jgi:hypothetical protein
MPPWPSIPASSPQKGCGATVVFDANHGDQRRGVFSSRARTRVVASRRRTARRPDWRNSFLVSRVAQWSCKSFSSCHPPKSPRDRQQVTAGRDRPRTSWATHVRHGRPKPLPLFHIPAAARHQPTQLTSARAHMRPAPTGARARAHARKRPPREATQRLTACAGAGSPAPRPPRSAPRPCRGVSTQYFVTRTGVT